MNEDKVMRHKDLCDGLNQLYARKNHDYGDSFHQTFVEEGLAMARIRLGDKFSRFKHRQHSAAGYGRVHSGHSARSRQLRHHDRPGTGSGRGGANRAV